MEPNTIKLEVVTPERRVIDATATEIQFPGKAGYLGILPGHAPLLTEIGIGILSYVADGETHSAVVCYGFAEVLSDRVTLLADVAEREEDIDAARAKAARERAEKRLTGIELETDWDRAAAALQRAMVRLQIASKGGPSSTGSDG